MAGRSKKTDTFLSHNSHDKAFAEHLKEILLNRQLTAWIDKSELQPGMPWPSELSRAIDRCKSVVVLIGGSGIGKWQLEEIQYAIKKAVERKMPVIGVLIPGAPDIDKLKIPDSLTTRGMIDLRNGLDETSLKSLIWGITGKKQVIPPSPAYLFSASETSIGDDWLDERVVEKLKLRGRPLLDAYGELFTILSTDRRESIAFDKMLDGLEAKKQEKRTVASVSGFAGTGKSTFLICMYYAQKLRNEENKEHLFPIFINLRTFLSRSNSEPQSCPELAKELARYIDQCILDAPANGTGILLIVDGCDEYYRHRAQTEIDTTLQDKLEKLNAPGKVVKVVGVGQGNEVFPGFVPMDSMKKFFPSLLIDLHPVKVEDPALNVLIHAYVRVNGYENEIEMVEKLEKLICDLAIPEVDLFVLSLLESAVLTRWKPIEQGIGSLYFDNCLDRVRKVGGDVVKTHETAKRLLKILAEATFQIYVPDVKEFDRVVQDTVSQYPDLRAILPALIAEIPHLHASVKEFLIAENAIEIILNRDIPLEENDGVIYPYGVNRFVKSIINRSTIAQNEILAKVASVIHEAPIRQRIHLSYILGRFKDRNVRQSARRLLHDVLERMADTGPDLRTLSNPVKSVEARNWLLLQRTVYISLIYLDDQKAATDYLMEMLEHPVCDNLNRGFHIQYYQDLNHPPKSLDMIEPDVLEVEPLRTFDVLIEKLQHDILLGKPRPMSCIELFTVCSLCVNRHIIGALTPSRLRDRLYEFLKPLKAEDLDFPKEAWAYIEMARGLIGRESVTISDVFEELHALKDEPRAGWNATRIIDGIPHVRICPDPESVSDHIWGTMMIASTFLPEYPPDEAEYIGYSKSRIILMLMIHDLAEAYLGDKPSFLKIGEDKVAEDRCMARIIALSTLDVFNGVLSWRCLWSEWRGKASINAQIAFEIDAIESFLQMRRYLKKPNCVIPDADSWERDVAEVVDSTLGRKIFASLRHVHQV